MNSLTSHALRAVPAAAALLLLAACAVGPDYSAQVADAPPDFSAWHGGSAELVDAAQVAPAAAAPFGWSVFADPTLDALQAKALSANSDLQTAALRFAQSRVQGDAARAQQWPQLNASGSATRVRESENGDFRRIIGALNPGAVDELVKVLSDPHDMFQAGFDASWELDFWGRVRRSIEAANADEAAAQALLAQAQLSVQAELARHYFQLRSVQSQLRLARADIAAGQETRELVAARANGGLTTDLDVARQDAQLADARARLPQLLSQEAAEMNQISLLLGERPGALQAELAARPDAERAAALPDLSLGLPSDVALRRPDIRRAEAQLHAATANIGVAVADLYPRITLGASLGLNSVDASTFTDWGSRQWQIGPSLQLPIFDGGRRRATVTLSKLQAQEAAVAYQHTVLQAWQEIDDALSAYSAERQRNAQLALKARASRDAYQLAGVRYSHGLTDFLVQLDAQRTLLQAQRDYAESSGRLAIALVSIAKALALPASAPQAAAPVALGAAAPATAFK